MTDTDTITEPPELAFNWDNITPITGGWRIKKNTAGTCYVDVLQMIVNYRIVLTPVDDDSCYIRHWCYSGNTPGDFLRTMLAAIAWDGSLDTEPVGWNKNGQTGERKAAV